MNTCLDHWELDQRPFEATFEEPFFFAGRQHREAMERLLYLIRDGHMGFGLLTGEIGCGKSMVASVLQKRLRGRECQVVLLENAYGAFDELLREILAGMNPLPGGRRRLPGRDRSESRYDMIRRFRELLEQKFARLRRQLVIMLDEAQQLSEEALIELKNLTNFSNLAAGSLSVILVGQPELAELVRSLPQIDQRVGLRYHLMPLDAEDTGAYVDWRLRAAGYRGAESPFSAEAKQALHEASGGIPREINRICKLALDRAFAGEHPTIPTTIVEEISADVLRQNAWSL